MDNKTNSLCPRTYILMQEMDERTKKVRRHLTIFGFIEENEAGKKCAKGRDSASSGLRCSVKAALEKCFSMNSQREGL